MQATMPTPKQWTGTFVSHSDIDADLFTGANVLGHIRRSHPELAYREQFAAQATGASWH